MAPRAGFEPATNRLTAGCSTAELPGNLRARSLARPAGHGYINLDRRNQFVDEADDADTASQADDPFWTLQPESTGDPAAADYLGRRPVHRRRAGVSADRGVLDAAARHPRPFLRIPSDSALSPAVRGLVGT